MAATIFYSNSIVSQLRQDNRQIVNVYSRIIANTINEESDANLGFVFDEIIKKVQFPIIYTDRLNNPLYSRNINQHKDKHDLNEHVKNMDITKANKEYKKILPSIVFIMQSINTMICYGKRVCAYRMGIKNINDRKPFLIPTEHGIKKSKTIAIELGRY